MKDNSKNKKKDDLAVAMAVRQACIEQAKEGFRDASMSGLCAEGSMEAAVSAIERIDIEQIIENIDIS